MWKEPVVMNLVIYYSYSDSMRVNMLKLSVI